MERTQESLAALALLRGNFPTMKLSSFTTNDGHRFYYLDVLLIKQVLENALGYFSSAEIGVTIRWKGNDELLQLSLKEFMDLINASCRNYINMRKRQVREARKKKRKKI